MLMRQVGLAHSGEDGDVVYEELSGEDALVKITVKVPDEHKGV